MKRKRKLKKKFVVFLFSYALFFVSYFTMTTFARYTSSLNINGNISVAKWDVSVAGEDITTLPPMFIGHENTYQSYNLSVTTKSEIALTYSVIISNVPTGVRIQVDDDNQNIYSGNTITIENLGRLDSGNQTANHILTILVPSGTASFSETQLDIDVIFTQVNL